MGLEDSLGERLRRREALITLGGLGAGGLLVAARGPLGLVRAEPADAASTCVLTPEVTEGPYWIANGLTRRDITSGQTGIPLLLYLTVEDSSTCEPISGADVELWHANRLGAYSGVNGNSQRYLRGHQKSNSKGLRHLQDDLPGVVPRPHAAHPRQGPRRGLGRPHRPAVLRRHRQQRRLQDFSLQVAWPGRHEERGRLDLRRRRPRPVQAAPDQALREPGLPRLDDDDRAELSTPLYKPRQWRRWTSARNWPDIGSRRLSAEAGWESSIGQGTSTSTALWRSR